MRLWSLHPKYLDPQGLVALWREGLLARAVLNGETRGYKNHPQLDRFKSHAGSIIDVYLTQVFNESVTRGYSFDRGKIDRVNTTMQIDVTAGQIKFEWRHLLAKLTARSPLIADRWRKVTPESHPLFRIIPGEIEPWERG